jgi:hypothetical protein
MYVYVYLRIQGSTKLSRQKTLIFFFLLSCFECKLGNQPLRFRAASAAKTLLFGITFFLYQNGNPADHMICWEHFYASLTYARMDVCVYMCMYLYVCIIHTYVLYIRMYVYIIYT